MNNTSRQVATAAKTAARKLLLAGDAGRRKILFSIADNLLKNETEILEANKIDIAEAEKTNYAYIKRLGLTPAKLQTLSDGIRSIAESRDPVGQVLERTELSEGLVLEKTSAPIGVILTIFESRPDCLPQIAALSLKSGNGVILKGGKESLNSCRVLHRIIQSAVEDTSEGKVQGSVVGMVEGRDDISELLKLDDCIDLVIPRGSSSLVKHIEDNTNIPVLGHSEGLCHVYVDSDINLEMAIRVVLDSKTDYPSACNAVETLLLHKSLFEGKQHAQAIIKALVAAGVKVYADEECRAKIEGLDVLDSFRTEYCDMSVSVGVVNSLADAIDHIHKYGSGHTESIVTESKENAEYFLSNVDSSSIYHNCSTRFADGFRYGLGAEVGISTKKIHARGPVGVMGLTTTRFKLRSGDTTKGHCAGDFSNGKRTWTHQKLEI